MLDRDVLTIRNRIFPALEPEAPLKKLRPVPGPNQYRQETQHHQQNQDAHRNYTSAVGYCSRLQGNLDTGNQPERYNEPGNGENKQCAWVRLAHRQTPPKGGVIHLLQDPSPPIYRFGYKRTGWYPHWVLHFEQAFAII